MNARHQLVIEIFQIARRWRVRLDDRLRPAGLTKSAWAVLYWVSRSPEGVTQRELAARIGVETSTLTRQLDAMERQGWVERLSVDGDRRLKLVRRTARAVAVMRDAAPLTQSLRDELLDGVSEQDLEITVKVLQQVHARLRPVSS